VARILIVEDNEMNRDMLSRRLARAGHESLVAETATTGILMARSASSDPATKSLPIIALTAHAMATDREAALAAGCDEFETKPVDFARLTSKIEALLARSRRDV
jgi:two-component system cell cycle response regulator DivK